MLACRECLHPIDEGQIRFPVLLGEARDDVAEVGRIERRLVIDLAREEAFAERTERHESDAEFASAGSTSCSGSRHQSEYSL
jgi:hypothetical protein